MPPSITYHTSNPPNWSGIGINLTASQVDQNFFNIVQSIVDLENDRPEPNNIASISVSGQFMTITLDDATEIGPLQLPVLQYHWRNDWTANTLYLPLDTFKVDGQGLYSVLIEHTSDATTFNQDAVDEDDNPLYFKLFGFNPSADTLSTDPQNGQIYRYNSDSGLFENVFLRYPLTANFNGTMGANQDLLHHKFACDVEFPANFGDHLEYSSVAGAVLDATADTVITIAVAPLATPNTFTTIGTITIAAGTITPTFATVGGTAKSASKGDVIRIRGPASPDATLSGFYCTVVAREA